MIVKNKKIYIRILWKALLFLRLDSFKVDLLSAICGIIIERIDKQLMALET